MALKILENVRAPRELSRRLKKLRESCSIDEAIVFLGDLAEYHGTKDKHFLRWLEFVRSEGVSMSFALGLLSDQALRVLGLWAIGGTERAVGLDAYQRFLNAEKKECGPFDGENAIFLLALFEENRDDEILKTLDQLAKELGECPLESVVGLAARSRRGQKGQLESLQEKAHNQRAPLDERALAILLLDQVCPSPEWFAIADQILKGPDPFWNYFRARLEALMKKAPAELPKVAAATMKKERDLSGAPKYVIGPGKSSTHIFGGSRWKTPSCRGCGHPIIAWFTLDTKTIPELSKWLSWRQTPLLSCADCNTWMGVHQYTVNPENNTITLESVALPHNRKYSKPFITTERPRKQAAVIKPVTPAQWRKLSEQTEPSVVAGKPPRIGDNEWPMCPACQKKMRYFGALGQSDGFKGQPTIVNDAGFLLHFACSACNKLTVVPNWT